MSVARGGAGPVAGVPLLKPWTPGSRVRLVWQTFEILI